MTDKIGEAYIKIVMEGLEKIKTDLKSLEKETETSVKKTEATVNSSNSRTLAFKKAMNQQQLKEIQKFESQVLALKKAMNQQQLKEIQKADSQTLAFKKAMNTQRLKEEQVYAANYKSLNDRLSSESIAGQKILSDRIKTELVKRNEANEWLARQTAAGNAAILRNQIETDKQILTFKRAMNAQRIREESTTDKQILAFKRAMNAQRIKEERAKVRAISAANKELQRMSLTGHQVLQAQQKKTTATTNDLNAATSKTKATFAQTTIGVLRAAPAFAVATAAISGVYIAIRTLTNGLVFGLKAVEDFKLKTASMAAFITTFADKSQEGGDIGKIYIRAKGEAEKLISVLEILDARTVATGRDLATIAEQFIKGGVAINIQSKEVQDGLVNIANAAKLLTAGQNQEIQMRQEIRSLVNGQLRDTNVLVKTLEAIDPEIKKNLKTWKEQGTVIENVGRLLGGFAPAAMDLEQTWSAIGTSLETTLARTLRGGMLPVYQDLLKLATDLKSVYVDQNGALTEQAIIVQEKIQKGWKNIKSITRGVVDVWNSMGDGVIAVTKLIVLAKGAQILLNSVVKANPYYVAGAFFVGSISYLKTLVDKINAGTDAQKGFNEELANTKASIFEKEVALIIKAWNRLTDFKKGESVEISIGASGDVFQIESQIAEIERKIEEKKANLTTGELWEQKGSVRGTTELDGLTNQLDSLKAKLIEVKRVNLFENWDAEANNPMQQSLKATRENLKLTYDYNSKLKEIGETLDINNDKYRTDAELRKSINAEINEQLALIEDERRRAEEGTVTGEALVKLLAEMDELVANAERVRAARLQVILDKEVAENLKAAKKITDIWQLQHEARLEQLDKDQKIGEKFKGKFNELSATIMPKVETTDEAKIAKLQRAWENLSEAAKLESGITLESFNELYANLTKTSESWLDGVTMGLDQYAKDSKSVFESVGDIVKNAFKGMEDALIDFVETGKYNFSDMVNSMLKDLLRLAIQQNITGPLASGLSGVLGSLGSSLFGAPASSAAGVSGMDATKLNFLAPSELGNIFNNGLQKFANGGAFTNSIVDKPTIFPFANGTGLMGEAGPEAIMPLERNSKGQLGVVASGGGEKPNVTVNVINNGQEDKQATTDVKFDMRGMIIDVFLEDYTSNGPTRQVMSGGI